MSERPISLGTSPLPPPVTARPALPKAPPLPRVEKVQPVDTERKRLEEENQELQKKLAAQREETRVEHKNVERLRSELALLKAKASARPTATMTSRAEVDQLKAHHLQEVRELKRKHQSEVDDVHKSHRLEIAQLKRDHQTELSKHDRQASLHEKQQLADAEQALAKLKGEFDELRESTAEILRQNAALREENDQLEKRLQEAEEKATAASTLAAASVADDLTELKGVGPKVAQALRALGITRFQQIASWTDADIDEIAPRLKTAAGRIKKSDWVGQARRRTS